MFFIKLGIDIARSLIIGGEFELGTSYRWSLGRLWSNAECDIALELKLLCRFLLVLGYEELLYAENDGFNWLSMFWIVKVKVLPTSFSDSTVMSPPKAFDNFLLIDNPNPQPYLLSSLSYIIFLNTVNKLLNSSGLIPTPVSTT